MSDKNKEWRCFFCDEVFTTEKEAAEHFGCFDACEADTPACKLMQHQKQFIKYVRELENEVRQYQAENKPLQKAIWCLENEIYIKEKQAEERGYAKGVSDMKSQGYCVEPQKHAS